MRACCAITAVVLLAGACSGDSDGDSAQLADAGGIARAGAGAPDREGPSNGMRGDGGKASNMNTPDAGGARRDAAVDDAGSARPDARVPDATDSGAASGPRCGDGKIEGAERCDDGNRATETACPYGIAECEHCNIDCTRALHFTGRYCGDGVDDPEEACDDGSANSNAWSLNAHCNQACTGPAPHCGDDAVAAQEACDDGARNGDAYVPPGVTPTCIRSCSGLAPHCGDGALGGFEICDEGAANSDGWAATVHCNANCSGVGPHCGNAVLESPELCDAGPGASSDWHQERVCLPGCLGHAPHCGDGTRDSGHEQCDLGAANTYAWSLAPGCNPSCSGPGPYCGDGVLNAPDEQCDDGAHATGYGCDAQCNREPDHACDLSVMPTRCAPCASPIHVRAGASAGGANGRSWASAYPSFDAAYAGGDFRYGVCAQLTFWVAQGTYLPTSDGSRARSFGFLPGSRVYGGFAGHETALAQRVLGATPSVLSGDLTGDDASPNGRANNSLHVVMLNSVTDLVLDGLTIRGGYANDGDTFGSYAGGLMIYGADAIVLRNAIVEDNYALKMGGALNLLASGHVTIERSVLRNNESLEGGGALSHYQGTLELLDVEVTGNVAGSLGAGVYNLSGELLVDGSTFEGNVSSSGGGGLFDADRSDIRDSTFANNAATSGGGISAFGLRATQRNVRFIANQAQFGAGLYVGSGSDQLVDGRFFGNRASSGGGSYVYQNGRADFIQALFSGNSATVNGGGALVLGDARFANAAFAGNSAGSAGGALHDSGNVTSTQLDNSVLWGNGPSPLVVAAGGAAFDVGWSCIEGGFAGSNNLAQCGPGGAGSPFADADGADDALGTADDDLQLAPGSGAIDSGRVAALVVELGGLTTDLAGKPRAVRQIDRGPFELQP